MAFPLSPIFSLLLALLLSTPTSNAAEIDAAPHLMNQTLQWQHFEPEISQQEEDGDVLHRRSLNWYAPAASRRYYISYVALSANRVPCPPRSGRSYYTHNCFGARGPVHPYSRGCSAITRCRR